MRLVAVGVFVLLLLACFKSVRAEDVVLSEAIRETQCADIALSRGDGGTYVAKGCGRKLVYACARAAGIGVTNPGTVDDTDCKKVEAAP
jgi:hypothetical protein